MNLRSIFANGWTKLLALIFSASIWFYINSIVTDQKEVTIPVSARLPPHLTLRSQSLSSFKVTVAGPRGQVNSLTPEMLAIVPEIPEDIVAPEETTKEYRMEMTKFFRLPPNINFVPSPRTPLEQIKFSLEVLTTRSLPLRACFKGNPAAGFVLNEVRLRPSEVEVRGPHSILTSARQIDTLPIPLEGRNATFSLRASLAPVINGQPISPSLPPGEIIVEIVIRPEDLTRTLTVPLAVLAPPGFPFRYILPEESVTLTFRGPARSFSSPERLAVYLDLLEYPVETLRPMLNNYARDNPKSRASLPLSYTLHPRYGNGPVLEGEPKLPIRFVVPQEEKP